MLTLAPVSFNDLLPFVEDFKKRAIHFEPPTDNAKALGIFKDNLLAGYFIVSNMQVDTLLIEQGYLSKSARHKSLHVLAMQLLQQDAKRCGYKRIVLQACRSIKAYLKFMGAIGYQPKQIVFSKEL